MAIVWLASYPKSGNTWLRAVLTDYLSAAAEQPGINDLIAAAHASSRHWFEEHMGLDAAHLTAGELSRFRRRFQGLLAGVLPSPTFIKTHGAFSGDERGESLLAHGANGAIYLLRNPLDVAVSYSHQLMCSASQAVGQMCDPQAKEGHRKRGATTNLPERLTTWSGHVLSWVHQSRLPVHVARYEDLLAAPLAGFGAIIRFAGLAWDEARLQQSVENTQFERLREQEERSPFREKNPAAQRFFRCGVANAWPAKLTRADVAEMVATNAPAMRRFGYLEAAEAFLGRKQGPA